VAACVVRVGVVPALRAADGVIAVAVPLVPIVLAIGRGNIVLRVVRIALNGDALIPVNASAALRRGDFAEPCERPRWFRRLN